MHFSIKGPELWDAEFATNLWRTSLNTKNQCTKLDGGATKCGHVQYVTTEVISWSVLFTTWWRNTMICLTARWKSTSATTVTFRAAIHGLFKSIASAFMVRAVAFYLCCSSFDLPDLFFWILGGWPKSQATTYYLVFWKKIIYLKIM